jgi:DNA-binding transcriptional ArsR family regulator
LTSAAWLVKVNQLVKHRDRPADAVYRAISHPVRRSVLDRLRPGGSTVTELASHYPMSLVAVSKHIRVLEAAGLVHRTVEGREHHLMLAPDALREAAGWLHSYRRFWEERLDLLDSRIRARKPK